MKKLVPKIAIVLLASSALVGVGVAKKVSTPTVIQPKTVVNLTPTCTFGGWTAQAGHPVYWHVGCSGVAGPVTITMHKIDGTAKAGADYQGGDQTLYFGTLPQTIAVETQTMVNPANADKTVDFSAVLLFNGKQISNAGSHIVQPAAPPPPPTPTPPPPTPTPTPTPLPTNAVFADDSGGLAAPLTSNDNPMVGLSPGVGAVDIPTTDHNVLDDLTTSWDCVNGVCGQPAPATQAFEDLGAFRFICAPTNLGQDDPTVAPNRPGASHWHDQTGVKAWNAYLNYARARLLGGGSKCNDVAGYDHDATKATHAANRTPYWQPALFDGKGHILRADYTSFYYKRRPDTDPTVGSDPTVKGYLGKAVPLANGLKFLFGGHPENPLLPPDAGSNITFSCVDPKGASLMMAHPGDPGGMTPIVACASQTPGGWFEVRAGAPNCWDGVHLDVADHRSHINYPKDTHLGWSSCDAQHPFVVPTFTYAAFYTIMPTDDPALIHFASDEDPATGKVRAGQTPGWSFHVDYGPASWDPLVLAMWTDNCINKKLNCSGGDLGNGKQLKGAQNPIYKQADGTYIGAWHIPPEMRLVPIPGGAQMMQMHHPLTPMGVGERGR